MNDSVSAISPGKFPGAIAFSFVLFWFAALAHAGDTGLLRSWSGIGPFSALQTAMFAPVILFFIVFYLIGPFRKYITELDPVVLGAFQIMRIFGASHFISWGYGLMAGVFVFAVGLGNIIVTFIALIAVHKTAYRTRNWRRWLFALTFIGLAEFMMTIALANLGLYERALPIDPEIAAAGYASFLALPISIFPSFLIPLFTVIHCATLMRLLYGARS